MRDALPTYEELAAEATRVMIERNELRAEIARLTREKETAEAECRRYRAVESQWIEDFNEQLADAVAQRERAETAEAALHHIKTWADAYPVEVFTPLSDAEVGACAEALDAAVKVGCGRMHASWARHLLTGIGEVAAAALRQSESGDRT